MGENIRMDLKEMGVKMRNYIGLAQDMDYCRALVNSASKLVLVTYLLTCLVMKENVFNYLFMQGMFQADGKKVFFIRTKVTTTT